LVELNDFGAHTFAEAIREIFQRQLIETDNNNLP
jgi:hypothetical protein